MIIFRKVVYNKLSGFDSGYSIWKYNTESNEECKISSNGISFDGIWKPYTKPDSDHEEFDITEEEAFLMML